MQSIQSIEKNPAKCDDDILSSDIDKPQDLDGGKFCRALCKFVTEIKKHNLDNYPPNSLHEMKCCIQMFLRTKRVMFNLLSEHDPIFGEPYNVVDTVMKQRVADGLGVVKSAMTVSLTMEEEIWPTGVLGEHQPKQLSDTIILLLGLNCVLRGGVEQKRLRRPGFQPRITIG